MKAATPASFDRCIYSDADLASSLPTGKTTPQPDNPNIFHQDGDIPTNSYTRHGDGNPIQRTEEQQCNGTPVNRDLLQHSDDDLTRSAFLKEDYAVVRFECKRMANISLHCS